MKHTRINIISVKYLSMSCQWYCVWIIGLLWGQHIMNQNQHFDLKHMSDFSNKNMWYIKNNADYRSLHEFFFLLEKNIVCTKVRSKYINKVLVEIYCNCNFIKQIVANTPHEVYEITETNLLWIKINSPGLWLSVFIIFGKSDNYMIPLMICIGAMRIICYPEL